MGNRAGGAIAWLGPRRRDRPTARTSCCRHAGARLMAVPIDHVVVLALENRSFDHMLGFVPHPDPRFGGLTSGGPFVNPAWHHRGSPIPATADAKLVLPADPDHSHDAVMRQLSVRGLGRRRRPTNRGFPASYEDKARGLVPPQFVGLLGPLASWWARRSGSANPVTGRGGLVMRCQAPDRVPVLSTLALQFGVCSRWFSSVPGETWPNRNFMHAATSHGTTNIELDFYTDRTIFELLEEHDKTWRVYYDDTPQVWAFRNLWDEGDRARNWFHYSEFASHVARAEDDPGALPNYSFIEPNHRPAVHALQYEPLLGEQDKSSSQHPGNNLVANADYDAYATTGDEDFARGEQLIADVYEALRAHPTVFERTLLLVTYDEHGGFFDHLAPPMDVPNPGADTTPDVLTRVRNLFLQRKAEAFDFTMLGPRVPALVISPRVPAGTVCDLPRDHASIPATLRKLFAPSAGSLTRRDAWAPPFDSLLSLDEPRADLPNLSRFKPIQPVTGALSAAAATALAAAAPSIGPVSPAGPEHYRAFAELSDRVGYVLPTPDPPATLPAVVRSAYVTAMFTAHATEARAAPDQH